MRDKLYSENSYPYKRVILNNIFIWSVGYAGLVLIFGFGAVLMREEESTVSRLVLFVWKSGYDAFF